MSDPKILKKILKSFQVCISKSIPHIIPYGINKESQDSVIIEDITNCWEFIKELRRYCCTPKLVTEI